MPPAPLPPPTFKGDSLLIKNAFAIFLAKVHSLGYTVNEGETLSVTPITGPVPSISYNSLPVQFALSAPVPSPPRASTAPEPSLRETRARDAAAPSEPTMSAKSRGRVTPPSKLEQKKRTGPAPVIVKVEKTSASFKRGVSMRRVAKGAKSVISTLAESIGKGQALKRSTVGPGAPATLVRAIDRGDSSFHRDASAINSRKVIPTATASKTALASKVSKDSHAQATLENDLDGADSKYMVDVVASKVPLPANTPKDSEASAASKRIQSTRRSLGKPMTTSPSPVQPAATMRQSSIEALTLSQAPSTRQSARSVVARTGRPVERFSPK
jgi:hypothetical protein